MAASWWSFCQSRVLRISLQKSSASLTPKVIRAWTRPVCTSSSLYREDTQLEDNPYYEKYADKIKAAQELLQKQEDTRSFEDKFKVDKRVVEETKKFKQKVEKSKQKAKKTMTINTLSESGEKSKYGEKTLDSVLRMELISELSGEEIGKLWREFHKDKDCISAVIPANVYKTIEERSTKYPLFIYPLPRESGYEFIYSEFSGKHCYLTSLINFQTMAENAPWFLAVTHFTELQDTKGVVLMVGEVDTNHLSVVDAQWLAYQIQMYYASDSAERESLLHTFNIEPNKFDHMSVVEQLNNEIASGAITADSQLKK